MANLEASSTQIGHPHGQVVEKTTRSSEYGQCQRKDAIVSPVALRLDPRFPFEEWRDLGGRIAKRASASLWWLGDWLHFGQEKYGRRYKDGIALTGLDYQTLRNYAMVARRYDVSRRRDKLSFQHHAEVCALTDADQDRWLDRAECAGWSRNELRGRLRAELTQRSPAVSAPLGLAVDAARRQIWDEAARRANCDLESWMVRTLDKAAATLLSVE